MEPSGALLFGLILVVAVLLIFGLVKRAGKSEPGKSHTRGHDSGGGGSAAVTGGAVATGSNDGPGDGAGAAGGGDGGGGGGGY